MGAGLRLTLSFRSVGLAAMIADLSTSSWFDMLLHVTDRQVVMYTADVR